MCIKKEGAEKMKLSLLYGNESPPPSAAWNEFVPLQRTYHFRIIATAIIYKLQIAATSGFNKGLIRKNIVGMSVCAITRAVVELASIPVIALWNFFICKKRHKGDSVEGTYFSLS
jgi:hypothetical protein